MPAAGQAKEEPRPAAIWFVSDFGDHLPPRFAVTGTLARVIHKVLSSVDELGHASSEAMIPNPPGQVRFAPGDLVVSVQTGNSIAPLDTRHECKGYVAVVSQYLS